MTTKYIGRTTPAGKRIVFAIAFDDEGMMDTITNTDTGALLSSASADGKRILRASDTIITGGAPAGYWKAERP